MRLVVLKSIVFVLFLSCLNHVASGQDLFNKESHVVHGGIGLGGFGFGTCYTQSPIINVSYDQGIFDELGIGNLGIGGAAGIKHYSWNCSYGNDNWSWNRIYLGARATYHFYFLNEEKLDLYSGVSLGAFIWTGDTDSPYGSYAPVLAPGLFGGGNYWWKPNVGVYAEVGYGLGFLNTGVAIKF